MINQVIYKIKQLMEGEQSLSFILEEIKKDIALDIIRTDFTDKERREELYMLTKAVDELSRKLQEYVNKVEEN